MNLKTESNYLSLVLGTLWHLFCIRFCFFLIFSVVLSDLFLGVLEYNLKEIAYAADVAQLGCVNFNCCASKLFTPVNICSLKSGNILMGIEKPLENISTSYKSLGPGYRDLSCVLLSSNRTSMKFH